MQQLLRPGWYYGFVPMSKKDFFGPHPDEATALRLAQEQYPEARGITLRHVAVCSSFADVCSLQTLGNRFVEVFAMESGGYAVDVQVMDADYTSTLTASEATDLGRALIATLDRLMMRRGTPPTLEHVHVWERDADGGWRRTPRL